MRGKLGWLVVMLVVGVVSSVWFSGVALAGAGASGVSAQVTGSQSDWLSAINYWRQAAGLAPVTDQPAWDLGIQNHLTYLEHTPASYMVGQYASAHTENPSSPYYTPSGATEAGDSDLDLGAAVSDVQAIDEWLTAPFHAIGMLRAQLTQVAFADDSAGYAGLDVLQGLDPKQSPATSPILFPGPGATTTLALANDGEFPDPLETCGWQGMRVGLPLIALLTQPPASGLTATLSGPTGTESTASGSLCVIDGSTYHSSDPVYGPTGASILNSDKAVLLVPRAPLADGTYVVEIQQPTQPSIKWSFGADIPPPTSVSPPAIGGWFVEGAQLAEFPGAWTNSPSTFADQWLRCDGSGANCNPVPGATGSTYSLTSADVGAAIRVQEIATNSGGPSSPAVSAPTAPILGDSTSTPPSTTNAPPTTTGSPRRTISSPPTTHRPPRASKSPQCALCVSATKPVALVVPSIVAGRVLTVSFAGWRPFGIKLTASTIAGHRLWRYTGHRHPGHWTIRVKLPRIATAHGQTVLITARFTFGARQMQQRRTVRFR